MTLFLRPLTSGITCCRSLSSSALRLNENSQKLVQEQFFDYPENFGKAHELRQRSRPGRPWTDEELRLKSNSDLHKLWYVCLKERNMLLTMQRACISKSRIMPNPERLDKIRETMKNIESVVHERNDAYFRLETGDGAGRPTRRVTSFMGFTYDKPANEHYLPPANGKKEYEVPYLDGDAYMMQKLWHEKEHMKELERQDMLALNKKMTQKRMKYNKASRTLIDRIED